MWFAFVRLLLVVALVAPATAIAQSKNRASGEVNFVDSRWRIVDAIAYPRDDGGWDLQLASVPFDPADVAADGEVDGFDGYRLVRDEGKFVLEVHIEADQTIGQAMVYRSSGGNGRGGPLIARSLQLEQPPGERLVGRIDYRDEGEFIEARFDVAIATPLPKTDSTPPAPSPEPAPEPATDSGARAVLIAYGEAIEKGDAKALFQTMPPDMRAAVGASDDADVTAPYLAMLASVHPIRIEVTDSTAQADDQVELRFRGQRQGASVTGTAMAQKIDGTWYLLGLVVDEAP